MENIENTDSVVHSTIPNYTVFYNEIYKKYLSVKLGRAEVISQAYNRLYPNDDYISKDSFYKTSEKIISETLEILGLELSKFNVTPGSKRATYEFPAFLGDFLKVLILRSSDSVSKKLRTQKSDLITHDELNDVLMDFFAEMEKNYKDNSSCLMFIQAKKKEAERRMEYIQQRDKMRLLMNQSLDKNIESYVATKWGEFGILNSLLSLFQIDESDRSITKEVLYHNSQTDKKGNYTIEQFEEDLVKGVYDEQLLDEKVSGDDFTEELREMDKKFLFNKLEENLLNAMQDTFAEWEKIVSAYREVIESSSFEEPGSGINLSVPDDIYREALKDVQNYNREEEPIPESCANALYEMFPELKNGLNIE